MKKSDLKDIVRIYDDSPQENEKKLKAEEETRKRMEALKPTKENPFCINMKGQE